MKVSLVYPYTHYTLKFGGIKRFQGVRGKYPQLGLVQLAGVLERAGHEVDIIDAEAEEHSERKVARRVYDFGSKAVGVYATHTSSRHAYRVGEAIKGTDLHPHLILGGPVTITFPRESLKCGPYEYGIIGEGDRSLPELLDVLEGKGDVGTVKGIAYKNNGDIKITHSSEGIDDLDRFPLPAWHLAPIPLYGDIISRKRRYTTAITSRGCPYRCIICDHTTHLGNVFRGLSPERVIEEVELLNQRHGVKEIFFFDDIFTFNRGRTLDICDMLTDRQSPLIWDCRTRIDLLDTELMEGMRRAGCVRLRLGVESGVPEIIKKTRKGITIDQARWTFKEASRIGLETVAYFMIGLPGDTSDTIRRSIDFSIRLRPTYCFYNISVLSTPGTELCRLAGNKRIHDLEYWKAYLRGDEGVKEMYFTPPNLNENDLEGFLKTANVRFYVRPRLIFRIMRLIMASPHRLIRVAKLLKDLIIPKKLL